MIFHGHPGAAQLIPELETKLVGCNEGVFGPCSKVLESVSTARVFGHIVWMDLVVGKPPAIVPNTSLRHYVRFIEFPSLRLDPYFFDFPRSEG